jgi:nucleoside-diphosphate-sugar epimerase
MKKILLTGGAGYVGSVLSKMLLDKGFQVICLDRFFFGYEPIDHLRKNPNFSIIKDDIRWFDKKILQDVYCVVDLASISNDPAGELDQEKTMDINYHGRVRVAQLAKSMGVKKYFLASTCSEYGFTDKVCNEKSELNPLTTYAKASAFAEKEILSLNDSKFSTTSFRFATIYGLSSRMRFDLVVNKMVLSLFQDGTIILDGGGNQRRPLIDVRDVCNAYLLGIEADMAVISGQIFNVGSNKQNYKIADLAKEIAKKIAIDHKTISKGNPDFRSYTVDFSKIKKLLSFQPKFDPPTSALEIYSELKSGRLVSDIKTRTVDWYLYLIKNGQNENQVLLNGKLL